MTEQKTKAETSANEMEGCFFSDGRLWGRCGGELEYVGQRLEWTELPNGDKQREIVFLFTDHDMWGIGEPELEPGVHYRLRMPMNDVPSLDVMKKAAIREFGK